MSYQEDFWRTAYQPGCDPLLEQRPESLNLKPAGAIPGKDRDLLKRLKPHHDHWLLEDPERVRYQHPGENLLFFVRGQKGRWEQVRRLPFQSRGQATYVFRRRPAEHGAGGGGSAEKPAAPLTLVGLGRWQEAQYTPTLEQVVNINIPDHLAEVPLNPDHQLILPQSTALALKVDGSAINTDSFRLQWQGPTSGADSVAVSRAAPRSGHTDTWETRIPDVRPGVYTITASTGGSTQSVQVHLLEPIYEIAYAPGTGNLYLLTPQQAERLKADARELEKPVRELRQAQNSGDAKAAIDAKENLSRKIKPLVKGPGSDKLTEIVLFKGRKLTYVDSDRLKNHVRSYSLDSDVRKRRELIDPKAKDQQGRKEVSVSLTDLAEIDCAELAEKIKKDLKKSAQGQLKYELTEIEPLTLALKSWAVPLAKQGDWFAASAEEQLLRFTAGAGLNVGFNPQSKAIKLKAKAEADLALIEGKVGCKVFLPQKNGYDVILQMPKKGSSEIVDLPLGAFLIELETALTGYAGAKAIACADLNFTMRQGKLMLGGLNSTEAKQLKQKDKHFTPAKAEISAFAGASAGCEAKGSLKWDNPEKRSAPDAREFHLLASIGGSIEGSAGAGAECGFYLGYDDGKFKFRAKAGVVLGVGCGGEVTYSVDVKHTAELVQFVYHSLLQGDFDCLEFIQNRAFEAVDLFVTRCIWMGEEIERLADEGYDAAVNWWEETSDKIFAEHTRQQEAERLAERILANPDMLRFAPPETKGRLLRALCEASLLSREERQEEAIIAILDWTQSQREYREILEHMTLDGSTIDYREGESYLNLILDGLEAYQLMWLQLRLAISDALDEREKSKVPKRAVAQVPVQKRFFA